MKNNSKWCKSEIYILVGRPKKVFRCILAEENILAQQRVINLGFELFWQGIGQRR